MTVHIVYYNSNDELDPFWVVRKVFKDKGVAERYIAAREVEYPVLKGKWMVKPHLVEDQPY